MVNHVLKPDYIILFVMVRDVHLTFDLCLYILHTHTYIHVNTYRTKREQKEKNGTFIITDVIEKYKFCFFEIKIMKKYFGKIIQQYIRILC